MPCSQLGEKVTSRLRLYLETADSHTPGRLTSSLAVLMLTTTTNWIGLSRPPFFHTILNTPARLSLNAWAMPPLGSTITIFSLIPPLVALVAKQMCRCKSISSCSVTYMTPPQDHATLSSIALSTFLQITLQPLALTMVEDLTWHGSRNTTTHLLTLSLPFFLFLLYCHLPFHCN